MIDHKTLKIPVSPFKILLIERVEFRELRSRVPGV